VSKATLVVVVASGCDWRKKRSAKAPFFPIEEGVRLLAVVSIAVIAVTTIVAITIVAVAVVVPVTAIVRVRAVAPVAVIDRHDGAAAERCDQNTNHESDLYSQSSQDGQSCPLVTFHCSRDVRNRQSPIIACAVLLLDLWSTAFE
jgi:hypothetical protein